MNVGILTYHRAHNYGALMQAVALRKFVELMGNKSFFVDYWPEYHKKQYDIFSIRKFKRFSFIGKMRYIFLILSKYHLIKKRQKSFFSFIKDYIEPHCKPTDNSFDVILIGSDQVWRKQGGLNDYNPVYFGDNKFKAKKQISYAASMGIMPKNEIEKERVKSLLNHINSISVREYDLRDLVLSLGYDAEVHVDPTFLLDRQQWDDLFPPKKQKDNDYLLFYNFQNNAFDEDEIYSYAKKHKLIVKTIVGGVRQDEKEEVLSTVGPTEFIELVRNASVIMTSSFHGLAFSIIYHKPFYASYCKNSNRAYTLLSELGLQDRLITPQSHIPQMKRIDYVHVDNVLLNLRTSAIEYLKKDLI